MANYEIFEHDVLIIGAGGAGLRAAIEASAAGVSVGLVCKSLLGKAHTVMAEGGIAAALANVDERDNWEVHFADTMRGGQYVNNWRMAELHAKEAPDRVSELEAWGAVFDRTKDGRILNRAPRFKLADAIWRFLRVELGHPPIVHVLTAAHRVCEVYFPIVSLVDVGKRGSDAAFCHHCVRFPQQRFANKSDRNTGR